MAIKKHIAQQLRAAADSTPTVFDWVMMPEQFTGAELNLTPLGEIMQLDADRVYTVDMPAMVAVDHYQQFKDAYKRGGWEAVREYHRSVMAKVKNSKKLAA